jgi:glycosyltransferase involved in cell wall biosynthesis
MEPPVALQAAAALLSGGWALASLDTIRAVRSARSLSEDPAPDPAEWPRLSVVVAARDEADTLEGALGTLLTASYPDLELVLVNDRSTDGTGALMERLAGRDPRVRVVHVRALPAGWLGKVHALEVGTRAATGDWVLYTDADVHHLPGCLERAVAVALAERLDHLTLWPTMVARSVFLRALILSFGVSLLAMTRPHRVGPGSRAFFGIGAFNLVRRSFFARTAGFEWLRMELADDMAVSKLVVDAGGRSGWRTARDHLRLEWYPTLGAMVRGLEKNAYGVFSRFSVIRFALKLSVVLALLLAPAVALLGGPAWCRAAGASALLATLAAHAAGARLVGFGAAEALLAPLFGVVAMLATLVRSAVVTWRHGGVAWRGTRYTVEELRRGQVVRL